MASLRDLALSFPAVKCEQASLQGTGSGGRRVRRVVATCSCARRHGLAFFELVHVCMCCADLQLQVMTAVDVVGPAASADISGAQEAIGLAAKARES